LGDGDTTLTLTWYLRFGSLFWPRHVARGYLNGEVLTSIWPSKRASLLSCLVTAAVVIGLVTAAGARADAFSDAQAALEQAAAQTGGAPPPVAPAKKAAPEPQKSWQTGGVAAPAADPVPAQSNVSISIRVQSPGNDGPTIQQNEAASGADFDRLEKDLKHELDVKLEELKKEVATPPPTPTLAPIRQVVTKPPPVHHRAKPPAPKPVVTHPAVHVMPAAQPLPKATPSPRPAHRAAHKARVNHHNNPFKLPPASENQAMSAGSGGTSTPPPAVTAVLLAAASFTASMLLTALWDAHRRRRSRLFASRLERPG
jgi:hypothetical protein